MSANAPQCSAYLLEVSWRRVSNSRAPAALKPGGSPQAVSEGNATTGNFVFRVKSRHWGTMKHWHHTADC